MPHWGAGVFSQFNKVITCMELYERVEVSWNPQKTPYKASKYANLWDAIAKPLNVFSKEEAAEAEVIIKYPHFNYTGRAAGWLYLKHDDWRERLHALYSRIEFQPEVLAMVPETRFSVGVLYRGATALDREQLNAKPIPCEEMLRAVLRQNPACSVFVVCDNEEDLRYFQKHLGTLGPRCAGFSRAWWMQVERAPTHGIDPHCQMTPFSEEHVRKIVAQTIALSRCSHLVHGVSNMATAALYMNPHLGHTFVQG